MTGPSAIGSENGTPTSMTSAPASSRPLSNSIVPAIEGSPAVMYGTNARRFAFRSAAKRSSMTVRLAAVAVVFDLEEVVANTDAIPLRAFGLDDGPTKLTGRVLVGE